MLFLTSAVEHLRIAAWHPLARGSGRRVGTTMRLSSALPLSVMQCKQLQVYYTGLLPAATCVACCCVSLLSSKWKQPDHHERFLICSESDVEDLGRNWSWHEADKDEEILVGRQGLTCVAKPLPCRLMKWIKHKRSVLNENHRRQCPPHLREEEEDREVSSLVYKYKISIPPQTSWVSETRDHLMQSQINASLLELWDSIANCWCRKQTGHQGTFVHVNMDWF